MKQNQFGGMSFKSDVAPALVCTARSPPDDRLCRQKASSAPPCPPSWGWGGGREREGGGDNLPAPNDHRVLVV